METIKRILNHSQSDFTFKKLSPQEREQRKCDWENDKTGDLNLKDGYNCEKCRNRGYFAVLMEQGGLYYPAFHECSCMNIRRTLRNLQRSGLQDVIKDKTFDKFIIKEPWQEIKNNAVNYAQNPDGWFFIGGQSGSGKTHLCTAICRELLLKGKEVKYLKWREVAPELKFKVNDPEAYTKRLDEFKKAEVLYIDDLFKVGQGTGSTQPTAADVNLAFEILNYRYTIPRLITIISSELTLDNLCIIDEAICGRIAELCKAGNKIGISKDRSKNYRLNQNENNIKK